MRHPLLFAMVVLVVAVLPARAQERSPMEALESQNEAILKAESLDEVVEYLPESARSRIEQMSEEEKAAGLEQWRQSTAGHRLVRERIADGRAVVLMETDDGVRLLRMTLVDGRWTVDGETFLMAATAGATGEFSVTGAVDHELEEGVVNQTRINGVPVLTVSDPLEEGLLEEDVPTVQLALPLCIATGTYPLEPQESGNATVGSRYWHPIGDGERIEFKEDVVGSLRVESVDGERFSGTFEIRGSAESTDGGEAVVVEGRIRDARIECDEEGL